MKNKTLYFGEEVEDLDLLPDAFVTLNSLTPSSFNYTISINNHSLIEFHWDNGFTKSSYKLLTPEVS